MRSHVATFAVIVAAVIVADILAKILTNNVRAIRRVTGA